ncbi:MAG: tetratricopeptide repeat protein [Actinomycetota bacterium]
MIGTRLRRLRVARGLTQRDLAEPKYTHAYVSTIEAGRRQPSREALEYFAGKLGVDVEQLVTGRPPDLVPQLELRLQEARIELSDGRFEQADETFRSVAKEAKRYGLSRIEARAEEGRGLWLERQGRPEEAFAHFQRADTILAAEPPTTRVDAVAGQGRCLHSLGQVRYEIHMLESLLDTIERGDLRDPDALARLHAALVFAYIEAGLYSAAAASAAELERLAPKLSDPARIAQMHMNVARLYLVQGNADEATRSLQRAEDAYRLLNLKTEMGGAHLARGYVLSREGKLREAREQLQHALAIFEQTANQTDLVRALDELARVERLEGNLDRAKELLERSIGLMGESDAPILAWTHRELGLTLAEVDPHTAEKHFRLAIGLFERTGQAVDIAVSYRALGDLLRSRGDDEAGFEAYRTGILALEPHL